MHKIRCEITFTEVPFSSGIYPYISSLLLSKLGGSQKHGECVSLVSLEEWLLNVSVEAHSFDLLVGGRSLDTEIDDCTFSQLLFTVQWYQQAFRC